MKKQPVNFHLAGAQPVVKWEGSRDCREWLRDSEATVEDVSGVTARRVWIELEIGQPDWPNAC